MKKHYLYFIVISIIMTSVYSCTYINARQNKPTDASSVILIDDVSRNFVNDGLNFIGVIGFVLGLLSLYYTKKTLDAQRLTEQHTTNAPKSAQIGRLKDLPRHFYRNLVCTSAMVVKYFDKSNKENDTKICYPSESNVLKLKTLPDDIIFDIDEEEKSYMIRHEFKLLLRNFNLEVDIASEHFTRKFISDDAIYQDIDNLIFKQFFIMKKSYDISISLEHISYPEIVAESFKTIIKEHFKKIREYYYKSNENIPTITNNDYQYLVNKILKNKNPFSVFSDNIDKKNGFIRSYNNIIQALIDYYSSDSNKNKNNDFGYINISIQQKSETITDNETSIKPISIIVKKKELIERIIEEDNPHDSYVNFINQITSISDIDKFKTFFHLNNNEIASTLYNKLSGYFDFMSKDQYELKTMLLTIVTMDCVIETDKIGMVNLSSLSR